MAKLVLLLVFVCFQFSKSEDLSAIEQVKLDLDEAPFNNQTGPDTEPLDGTDEEEWVPGPKFNEDWLNEEFSSTEEALNKTNSKGQTILDKLIELAGKIDDFSDEEYSDEYSDEDFSFDWDDLFDDDDDDEDDEYDDDDYDIWDLIKDWIYSAQNKQSLKNKNGKEYAYNRIMSSLKPKNLKEGKGHPVKRFTSV